MPDARRVTCRNCGKRTEEVGPITWRGNCIDCARTLKDAAADDLRNHNGPYFRRWRAGMAASVGAVLLDADPPNE